MSDNLLHLNGRKNRSVARQRNGHINSVDLARQLLAQPRVAHGYRVESLQYEVGKQIKLIRETAGFTQRRLAALAGTTQAAINKLESCRNPANPTLETLFKLADICGYDVQVGFVADRNRAGKG